MKNNPTLKVISNQWAHYKVDEVCSLVTNGFVGTATTHYTDSSDGVLYIQGYNVKENGFNFRGIKKVTKEFHKKNSKSCLKYKDLLTIQTGDTGLTSLVPRELEGANCHALIISRFKAELVNSHFILYFYNSEIGRSKLKRIEAGSTMKHINVSDLKALELALPPLPEQNRIVSVLETWNKAIEKLIKKIEIKKQIKKGLMQNLLTGKKRLGGFTDKWKFLKLSDIAINLDNKRIPLNSEDRAKKRGAIPYCGANGIVDYIDDYIFDEDIILVAEDGGQFNEYKTRPIAYRMKGRCWVNNHAHVVKAKKEFSQDLLFYLTVHKDILQYLNGGTRAKLNKSELLRIKYYISTDKEEQKAIANILITTDNEINQLGQKLSFLKDQKKYLLNNLITGAIRTPEDLLDKVK